MNGDHEQREPVRIRRAAPLRCRDPLQVLVIRTSSAIRAAPDRCCRFASLQRRRTRPDRSCSRAWMA
jgi:hypothetical protein